MFVDARSLPPETVLDCDLCIVGGGAAGITLAREFIGHGIKLVVLEGGGFEPEPEIQLLYEGEVADRFSLPLDDMRLRYFGGTTNHWAGFCRPLDAADFTARPWIPHSGWPFGLGEMIPYYRRAQPVCGLGEFDYSTESWAGAEHPIPAFDPTLLTTGLYQRSAPLRFGSAYREELDAAADVTVLHHGSAIEIETGPDGGRVIGLAAACLEGNRFRLRPRVTVLAAGGIENARLLLNSDRVARNGIGNGYDRVGRFFMDHPVFFRHGLLLPSDPNLPVAFFEGVRRADGAAHGLLTLPPALLAREGLPNVTISFGIVRKYSDGVVSMSRMLTDLRQGEIPDDLGRHIGRVILDLDEVAVAGYRRIMGEDLAPLDAMTLNTRVEPLPDPESRVTLTDARDALGLRRVRLDWRPGDAGIRALRRSNELVALEAGRLGIGRVRLDIPETAWPDKLQPSGHHIGTARMHDDPRSGVVDRDGRIHRIDSLYIAGSAVFPNAGCNNPTLTIVALALRLADHLKARFG